MDTSRILLETPIKGCFNYLHLRPRSFWWIPSIPPGLHPVILLYSAWHSPRSQSMGGSGMCSVSGVMKEWSPWSWSTTLWASKTMSVGKPWLCSKRGSGPPMVFLDYLL